MEVLGQALTSGAARPLQPKPFDYAMELRQRQTEYENLTLRVSEAIHMLKTNMLTKFSREIPRTVMLPLLATEKRFFSSLNQTDILVYRDDIVVREDWKTQWGEALSGYRRVAEIVENSGSTKLVTLVFPDKLNIYADYLASNRWQSNSVIPTLAAVRSLPRIDLRYKAAVEQGVVDLYLPNNTHTSSAGSKIANNEILLHLNERSIFKRYFLPGSAR